MQVKKETCDILCLEEANLCEILRDVEIVSMHKQGGEEYDVGVVKVWLPKVR